MDDTEITSVLDAAQAAVEAGMPIRPTGFWRAVAAVKPEPDLVEKHGGRIAAIDFAAFRQWALITVPLWLGTTIMVAGALAGLALVAWAYALEGTSAGIVFLVGFGVVLTTTHGLAHLLVGRVLGIRFTRWFIGSLARPQPGVKIDYASYLAASPRARAWMHASGALVGKVLPFALVGAAVAADLPVWVVWALLVVGVAQIVTDVLWSTNSSDWKRYRREMAFGHRS